MKAGPLLRISVSIAAESEEAVCELLGGLSGQPASVYHDAESGDVTASVYLAGANHWPAAPREALRAGLRRIRECGLNIGSGKVSARRVRREDWAESWKRHFKPIRVGGALLLKPSWSKLRARPGQKTVVLDPGLSFGTGQHPTTRFCLEQIVAARNRDSSQSLLDIGTGSGILAIAAVKLGYCPVEAFDFDPDAIRTAKANARKNSVSTRLHLDVRDLKRLPLKGRPFDVVCANLIDDLLVAERRRILRQLRSGGILVLAGILRTQFPAVRRTYEAEGLKMAAHSAENEWESGAFVQK